MGRIKRKYHSGTATAYISRKRALKKLQLSLPDFRRLCILKGIYPHEPKHRKKVERGGTAIRTYYFRKDIQFLLHEPIINNFRAFKVYSRKLKKATDKGEQGQVQRLKANKPRYRLDHIIKERYPSFIDALRDIDDCLCLVFLFATLPRNTSVKHLIVQRCQRLSVEFMHYLIAAKALRKVFVSIKGIYYQAEVMGQTVTWITPHPRGFQSSREVDYRMMSIFIEFYMSLLGFINYRLFSSLSISYPPRLELPSSADRYNSLRDMTEVEQLEESLASLTQSLTPTLQNVDDAEVDEFPAIEGDEDQTASAEEIRKQQLAVKALNKLFDGLKFFLGRETPRQSLTFVLRCSGAQVSWDPSVSAGASYLETDDTITHQIVDRNQPPKATYMNRYYIQPQWVYDCVNARKLLDVKQYMVGVVLPPHLSPFIEEGEDDYIPPERVQLLQRAEAKEEGDEAEGEEDMEAEDDDAELPPTSGGEEDLEDGESEEEEDMPSESDEQSDDGEPSPSPEEEESDEEVAQQAPVKKLSVTAGRQVVVDETKLAQKEKAEGKRLAEMMIPKKHKRLYNKIMYSKKKKAQEVRVLTEKRVKHDEEMKKEAKKRKASTS